MRKKESDLPSLRSNKEGIHVRGGIRFGIFAKVQPLRYLVRF